MVLYGNGIYDITALLPSGGSIGLQGLTVPNGGGWLTLRNDGTYQFSNGSDNQLHVLVMNLSTGPVSGSQVTVYYTGGSTIADTATTGADGQVAFTVTPSATQITFTVNSAGNGTVSPSGTQNFPQDSTQTFTATPSQGYRFDHWVMLNGSGQQNPDVSTQNPLSVKLVAGDNNGSLTAYFTAGAPTPTINPILVVGGVVTVAVIGYFVWSRVKHG